MAYIISDEADPFTSAHDPPSFLSPQRPNTISYFTLQDISNTFFPQMFFECPVYEMQ